MACDNLEGQATNMNNKHKDIPLPQEHVAGDHPQPEISHDLAMLTQIGGELKIYRKICQA